MGKIKKQNYLMGRTKFAERLQYKYCFLCIIVILDIPVILSLEG